jgi:glycerol-1-phosphatase
VTRPANRTLLGTDEPLATRYDVALLDLDGVVYVGPDPVAGAAQALARVRTAGMRLAFITNNAARDPAEVAAHLSALGVPASADDVVTSSQAAATLISERCGNGSTVLVTGSAALRRAVESAGLRVVASADDRPDAVVQGYAPTLCYADLAEAALAVRNGAVWVATNADSTLPSSRGLLPGNGSLVAMVATATGRRPLVAGKPQLPLHAEGVRRSRAHHPLVVGDRLDTDIEGASAAGTDSLLVLTGVSTAHELVSAPPVQRPTYLAMDLSGLLDTAPHVVDEGRLVRCGQWSAHLGGAAGARVELDGGGPAIDGLRALLTAVWSARREDIDATGALRQLGF